MSSTHRKFRFVRRAARAQWYLGPWFRVALVASGPGLVFLLGAQSSLVAWLICGVFCAYGGYQFWREVLVESVFWAERKNLTVSFEDGKLVVRSAHETRATDLSEYVSVDAVEEKGRIVRVLADRPDGQRDIYAGFDNMEAFAAEFRLDARKARFRRVKPGFPLTLKEV